MYLHARAVEFELQGGFPEAEFGQRFDDIVRGSSQHRLHGAKKLDIILSERGLALFQKGARYGGDISGQHHGAADAFHIGAGCFRERFHHHGLERSLPEFAHEQTHQELLFRLGCARQHLMQKLGTLALGAAPRSFDDGLKCSIHFRDFEARGFGRGTLGVTQGGVADTNASLANAAREEPDYDFDFLGAKLQQQARQQTYFFETLGGFRYAPGSLHHCRQQHVRRIAEMVWLLRACPNRG